MKNRNAALIYDSFGPYHYDRLEEVARRLSAENIKLYAIEFSGYDGTYKWEKKTGLNYELVTLFEQPFPKTTAISRFLKLFKFLISHDCDVVFHCGYQRIDSIFLSIFLRIFKRRIYTLIDSKYDDKPRYIWKELTKYFFLLPYNGALVSGVRTAEYMRLYGFDESCIFFGHNSLSLERVRTLAGKNGEITKFEDRNFVVVARFVKKKNYDFIIDVYAAYRKMVGAPPRSLHLYGDGPEMDRIVQRVKDEEIPGVHFHGWASSETIAQAMGQSLCLLLLSKEEQWGNVVNEAIAVGLPAICTRNVGATDHLVKTFVNGFIVEADNVAGTAYAMYAISTNEALYSTLVQGCKSLEESADAPMYGKAVVNAIHLDPQNGTSWW